MLACGHAHPDRRLPARNQHLRAHPNRAMTILCGAAPFPPWRAAPMCWRMRDVNIPIGGFIRAMRGHAELLPVLWAGATPAAHVEQDAFERIAGEIVDAARAREFRRHLSGPAWRHGLRAMTMTAKASCWPAARMSWARAFPSSPAWTCMPMSRAGCWSSADALVAYRTYPHEDMARSRRARRRSAETPAGSAARGCGRPPGGCRS